MQVSAETDPDPRPASPSEASASPDAVFVATAARQDETDVDAPARTTDSTTAVRRPIPMRELIEQIMITARKREEDLQRAPLAVTAFTPRAIEALNARRLPDLDAAVPNLAFSNSLGASNAGRVTLRGIGQGDLLASTDPGVAIYVDGVYNPRAQGQLRGLTDIERVEVLRGPQGTLFGKNAIGGAVNVITRRPSFTQSGEASVRIGNYDALETRLAVNVPLMPEVAAARFSLATNYDDGWQKNALTGRKGSTERLLFGQAELLVLPSESLEILLSVDFSREDRHPQASRCKVVPPPQGQAPPSLALAALSGVLDACARSQGLSYRKFISDVDSSDDLDSYGYSAQVRWDVSDNLTLTSITAVRHQDNRFAGDADGTEVNFAQPQLGTMQTKQRLWNQELRLNGRAMTGRLSYVVGAFALGETITENPLGNFIFPDSINNNLAVIEETDKVNNRSFALFGEVSYALTDSVTVSAGVRRTTERKRIRKQDIFQRAGFLLGSPVPIFIPQGTPAFGFEESKRFSKYTPMASIQYQLAPQTMVYATWSTGFRSGGFNGRANFVNPDITPVSQEDLTSYEVGVKSTLWDNRLQINASLFTSDYDDIQRTIITEINGTQAVAVRNAAEATLRGGELEITALPMAGLTLSSAVGVLRTRYRDFDFTRDPTIDDARFENAPNITLNLAAEYAFNLGDMGLLSTRLEWTQQGKKANTTSDLRQLRTSRYGLLDGRIALELNDGRTEISIFGDNLLNREYIDNGVDFSAAFGYVLELPGEPRRYGLQVSRQF